MAYHGYIQVLCRNGHLDVLDVSSDDGSIYAWVFDPVRFAELQPITIHAGEPDHVLWRCPVCGQLAAWVNRYSVWWDEPGMWEMREGPVALEFAQPPVYKIPPMDFDRGEYLDIPREARKRIACEGSRTGEEGVRETGGEREGSGGA